MIETPIRVEVHPAPTDSVLANLPPGSVVRVHHPDQTRDYPVEPHAPVLNIPGDHHTLYPPKWLKLGIPYAVYHDIDTVWRRCCHPFDRDVWDGAVQAIADGGVLLIHHERRDWLGQQTRWAATGFTTHQGDDQR